MFRNYFNKKSFSSVTNRDVAAQEKIAAQRLAECMSNPEAAGCKEYLALNKAKVEAMKKSSEVTN